MENIQHFQLTGCVQRRLQCVASGTADSKKNLLQDLRLPDMSYSQFRQLLKKFLFGKWDHNAVYND